MGVRPQQPLNKGKPQLQKRLIITGCPRSGTVWMTTFLKKNGLNINHERMGLDGTVDWEQAGEEQRPKYEQNSIYLHQVRHPLRCIASLTSFGKQNPTFRKAGYWLQEHINVVNLHSAMKFWLLWNRRAERRCKWTYQIENVPFERISEEIGFELKSHFADLLAPNINTRRHVDYKWDDLEREDKELTSQIVELGLRYGYDIAY